MKNNSVVMNICDFHSHILPGADHGSSSLDTSLRQLSLAVECGVSRVIATPHFYPEREDVETFIARRDKSFSLLTENNNTSVSVRLGAEVLICENLEKIPMLESLCLKGSDVLLLELPTLDFSESYRYVVSDLIEKGIKVIIAHADRYERENVDKLVSLGAKIQLNADSLSGLFIAPHLFNWLDEGVVVALGSDIHREDKRAYKRFLRAQKRIERYLPYIKEKSDEIWNSLSE